MVINMDKDFCKIYVEYIFEYIIREIEDDEKIDFHIEKVPYLKETMEKEIFKRCFKSLLYCMNVNRVEGRLAGGTPQERYLWFVNNQYCIDSMEEMFPAMKTQLYEEMKGKCIYVLSVINLFQKNKSDICQYFFNTESEGIINIANSGDWHNDKCVLVITFTSNKKIVFKPTSGDNLNFLKGVIRYFFEAEYTSQYGCIYESEGTWVKFVEYERAADESAVSQFYFNYGKLLFVAYLLGMNDMHYENLIAHGEYPVITDVETLLSSYLFFDTHKFEYDAQYKAVQRLLYGVMATGLIPIFSMTEYFGGDVSCLSNKGIKIITEKVENEYRDDMYIYTKPEIITQYSHLPDEKADPLLYGDQIINGFGQAENIFREEKAEIINYILSNLYRIESRIILNMTKGYSQIVRIKSDPRYRHEPELFEKLLGGLKRSNQFNQSVYLYEVTELCRSNIPSFYWNIRLNYVYGYHGKTTQKILDMHEFNMKKIAGILEEQTDVQMLARQKKLVMDSISSSIALGIEYKSMEASAKKEIRFDSNELLRKNIDDNRIEGDDGTISWIGLMVNDKEQLEYAVLDWSLYSGMVGIGYMYLAEYLNSKDELAKTIVNKIYRTIVMAYRSGTFEEYNISYFCGLSGIYAFMVQIKESRFAGYDEIEPYIMGIKELIKTNIVKTNSYDTLSGIHSAVIYFFARYETDEFAKEMIPVLKRYFMSTFKMNIMEKDFNYASFAHGYSGIITSVMCMNRIEKCEYFAELARELWRKEKQLYAGMHMWKDLRSSKEEYSHFWCHGSCGIMHARLIWRKWNFIRDGIIEMSEADLDEMLFQYSEAIKSEKLNSQNFSLCHGNFAFVDFLLSYDTLFGEIPEEKTYILRTMETAKQQGYSCIGAPGAINAIGFMVGEAGVQYMLDRCKDRKLPSILAIENI
ncbi:type 2 lantibiotic biosynthesis protein LanM [Kineothrix alysoides]|uniref:Type 2 lantibiotic biosynthesis protein LanM n=1 Tax=Kineothrix alysoides TaxID=1469948 RepID=A0A4R1QMP3_9FIRM|nr:type 2 lanthipeptide synthetase LanM family protein [Kineothrix alysoides]TCL54999.1 type 2 lantibiotic biosynthesis protein LanM [Kineothrix alysoides]